MPKPEKHVFVCTQSRPPGHPRGSCGANSSMELYEEFLWQLQSKDLMERFLVTPAGCMGPCFNGPSVVVYPDGVMYGNVTKDDVDAILDEHLVGGRPVDRLKVPEDIWG